MKTKLYIAILSIISAVSISFVALPYMNNDIAKVTENIAVCSVFSDWDEVIC